MSNTKETVLVMGASPKSYRYSYMATEMLNEYGHKAVCFGRHKGSIGNEEIVQQFPTEFKIDTITMYLSAANQKEFYKNILDLKPKRVIFNPGAENEELEDLLEENGIEPIEACTLVMLRTGQF